MAAKPASISTDQRWYTEGQWVSISGNIGNLSNPYYTVAYTPGEGKAPVNLAAGPITAESNGNFAIANVWQAAYQGSPPTFKAFLHEQGTDFTQSTYKDNFGVRQGTAVDTYVVTYDGNTADIGTPPFDPNEYEAGDTVTVLAVGDLAKTGYTFVEWNTLANGLGTGYDPGDTFPMPAANVTLYAIWEQDEADTYTVTYDGNGNDGGTAPVDNTDYEAGDTVTVLGPGSLTKDGYTFVEWNTLANGLGTGYDPGDTFPMPAANVTLYARWQPVEGPQTYTVTYNGNGNDGGTAPVDNNNYAQGATVTVLGSGTLTRTGYIFSVWNTSPSGEGTSRAPGSSFSMGTANVTLYAIWQPFTPPPGPDGTLVVRVVKTDAGNVGGLTVTIGGAVNATLTTNAGGVVTLGGLSAGTYNANSGDAGYTSDGPGTTTLPSDSSTGEIVITLTPEEEPPPQLGAIHGIVVEEETNIPLAGATVTVFGPGGVVYTTLTSDDDGEFFVDNVPPGNYGSVGTKTGYSSDTDGPVTVVAGETAEMVLVLAQIIVIPPDEPDQPQTGVGYLPSMLSGIALLAAGFGVRRRR